MATTSKPTLALSMDAKADALLSRDPLALLIGMVLDQQIPLEKAFRGPWDLQQRMGGKRLEARRIAAMDEDELIALFVRPPALHRFPAAMARRVRTLCVGLVESYGGKADAVWQGVADGADVLGRLKALPGFGEQKAKIFLALLGKQYGLDVPGWREAAGSYGEKGSRRSVADITGPDSLREVRAHKAEQKRLAKG